MPKIVEDAAGSQDRLLKPYVFHGLDLAGSPQAVGDCPFCGRDGKFSLSLETSKWRCFVCEASGNLLSFIRRVYEESTTDGLEELADDRGISVATLIAWGVKKHLITENIIIPGYATDGKLMQLYRYVQGKGKKLLLATPTLNHQLFGIPLFSPKKTDVHVCEGPWDAMKLWETLRTVKAGEDGGLARTGSSEGSLAGGINVLGIPGCGSVGEPMERWCSLLAGKQVCLLFDSDHPHAHGKDKVAEPAGWAAARRATQILARASQAPEIVRVLKWGTDGFDSQRKSGYDVRDLLNEEGAEVGIATLFSKIETIPEDWVKGRSHSSKKSGKVQIECMPCTDWKTLVTSWRKAMKWTPGLDKTLSVMLASALSTRAVGDQLWIKVVGPPSTGKTTLCEAFAIAKQYVFSADTMTGLISGYQIDRDGSENQSLVLRLDDKTLVIKDADTILTDPSLPKILAQFRAFYDRAIRAQYGNKMSAAHEGINTTVILCGTSSLRKLDSSELGERFLDCIILDEIEEEMENEVAMRVAHRAKRQLSQEANGRADSQTDPALLKAMQLTGGYIIHLRQNAQELLDHVECSHEALEHLVALGTFVSFMRARPSTRQEETVEREFSARLVSQLVRLANCLAVIMQKPSVDKEILDRTQEIALDTARGRTLDIAKYVHATGEKGVFIATLAALTSETDTKQREMLKFLRKIRAVEIIVVTNQMGIKGRPRWRLTDRLSRLFKKIFPK